MRPALLYLLFFCAIATAFVFLAPVSEHRTAVVPAETLARNRAAAITTRITFTSEATPASRSRPISFVANLQEPSPLESFPSREAIASARQVESEGTH